MLNIHISHVYIARLIMYSRSTILHGGANHMFVYLCTFVTLSQKVLRSSISCGHSPLVDRDINLFNLIVFLDCSFLDIFILQSWALWLP